MSSSLLIFIRYFFWPLWSSPFSSLEESMLIKVQLEMLVILYLLSKWLMEDVFLPYVRFLNSRFHLCRSSASSFSSKYLFLFLNQGSGIFFFHFNHLSFNVNTKMGNFFLEHDQSNLFFHAEYYLEVSSSLQFVQELIH